LPTLETLKFTLGTARNLILTLDQEGTLTDAARHEPERWEPLMDQLIRGEFARFEPIVKCRVIRAPDLRKVG
jgi:hypothetical protein